MPTATTAGFDVESRTASAAPFGGVGRPGFGDSGPEGIEDHLVTRNLTMPEREL
jgi:hypothetical protein